MWLLIQNGIKVNSCLKKGLLCERCHYLTISMNAKVSLVTGSSWWRHQMETFSTLLALCAGNSPVPGEFPAQRPVTRSFDVFFDLLLDKRFSKQSWGWWFEALSYPFWRHSNVSATIRVELTQLHVYRTLWKYHFPCHQYICYHPIWLLNTYPVILHKVSF